MLFNFSRGDFTEHSIGYTGEFEFSKVGRDWMAVFKSSGTLTLRRSITSADLCLVAAGMPGKAGVVNSSPNGVGGDGGGKVEATEVTLPAGTYTVTVGVSGQDTVVEAPDGRSWTAVSGDGKTGGRGNDRDGVLAWGDENTLLNAGWLYCAGGGSGATHVPGDARQASAPGGSVGAASEDTMVGHGGGIGTNAEEHQQGWDGCAGTGQGGGGGRYWNNQGWQGRDGGAGGSGAFLLRSHKEVAS